MNALEIRAALGRALPQGFALLAKEIWTNDGLQEVDLVIVTRTTAGHIQRRVGKVTSAGEKTFMPFGDAPWDAIQAVAAAGWSIR